MQGFELFFYDSRNIFSAFLYDSPKISGCLVKIHYTLRSLIVPEKTYRKHTYSLYASASVYIILMLNNFVVFAIDK